MQSRSGSGVEHAQLPLEEERRVATDVIDNSGDEPITQRQVEALVRRLLAVG